MLYSEKEAFVTNMRRQLESTVGLLFVDFTGITVEEVSEFRGILRKNNLGYQVVKNTLMKRVLEGKPWEDASKFLKGTPTALVLGYEDPVGAAKAAFDFSKKCNHLKIKGGIVESKPIELAEVEALSKMPSREELQASIVQLALAPVMNLLAQVKSPSESIVGAVEAKVKKEEEAA